MVDHLPLLEEAISDVGYWRWWTEALPDLFQVEFGGVQLHFAPASPEVAPNSVVALRFRQPTLVAFLTSKEPESVKLDWRLELHEDRIEPFGVSHELFTLTSEEVLQSVVAGCNIEYLVGTDLAQSARTSPVLLAFRAGEVGLVVRAASFSVIAVPGELTPEQIAKAAGDWWEYWREYWRRKDSATPMPKDYACEVTIPIK
jgi:hypothetical protein